MKRKRENPVQADPGGREKRGQVVPSRYSRMQNPCENPDPERQVAVQWQAGAEIQVQAQAGRQQAQECRKFQSGDGRCYRAGGDSAGGRQAGRTGEAGRQAEIPEL